jgi:hypothetical protein
MKKTLVRTLAALLISTSLGGCGRPDSSGPEAATARPENMPYTGGVGPQWLYNGPFTQPLENPELTISIVGHTARITGLLPADFDMSTLPYYAVTEPEGSRTRLHIVYPIATADTREESNSAPGIFRRPYVVARKTLNEIAEWGGFPFIVYNGGIGLHGPITAYGAGGSQWQLMRGRVSHGCNRMQGEHALELAQLIGTNVRSRVYGIDEYAGATAARVRVLPHGEYDTFKGQAVDVDYPVFNTSGRPAAVRPTATASRGVYMFPTWDGMKLSRFACQYNAASGLGASRCDHRAPNRIDPRTGGRSIGKLGCPEGYALVPVGTQGGQICSDGTNVWGPFTRAMIDKCVEFGGGLSACNSNRWSVAMAVSTRGTGLCPNGASFDAETGYCAEGVDAFGPFPLELVAKCIAANGGQTVCESGRWERNFLRRLL